MEILRGDIKKRGIRKGRRGVNKIHSQPSNVLGKDGGAKEIQRGRELT